MRFAVITNDVTSIKQWDASHESKIIKKKGMKIGTVHPFSCMLKDRHQNWVSSFCLTMIQSLRVVVG